MSTTDPSTVDPCQSATVTGGFTTALLLGALAFSGVAVAGYPVLGGGSATLLLVLIAVWLNVSSKYDLVQNHSNIPDEDEEDW